MYVIKIKQTGYKDLLYLILYIEADVEIGHSYCIPHLSTWSYCYVMNIACKI